MKYMTKSDLAYDVLKQDIISGQLPIGAKLTVTNLVERYDLGPMPIREALTKLTQEGLVQSTPHFGARVAEFNYYNHLESMMIRTCLERQLFKIALEFSDRITIDLLNDIYQEMRELLESGQVTEFSLARHEFFNSIFSVTPFEIFQQVTNGYYERLNIFHFFVSKISENDSTERTWELLSEIKLLIRCLEKKDFSACLIVFDQIQRNDFLTLARYLLSSLNHYSEDDSSYQFLWETSTELPPEKRDEIQRNIEMFIRIRAGDVGIE